MQSLYSWKTPLFFRFQVLPNVHISHFSFCKWSKWLLMTSCLHVLNIKTRFLLERKKTNIFRLCTSSKRKNARFYSGRDCYTTRGTRQPESLKGTWHHIPVCYAGFVRMRAVYITFTENAVYWWFSKLRWNKISWSIMISILVLNGHLT